MGLFQLIQEFSLIESILVRHYFHDHNKNNLKETGEIREAGTRIVEVSENVTNRTQSFSLGACSSLKSLTHQNDVQFLLLEEYKFSAFS